MEVWFLFVWLVAGEAPVVVHEGPSKTLCEEIARDHYARKKWRCRMALQI